MSWEVMTSNDYPCKCGKGTYTYISEMDDWSRSREEYILNCDYCKEKYVFSEGSFISNEVVKITTKFHKQIDKYVDELNDYMKNTYDSSWLMLFNSCKTKKDYWNRLVRIKKELGIYSHSLGTFYKDVKGYESIENYLLQLFYSYSTYKETDHHIFDRLVKLMDISDKQIQEIKTQISIVYIEMKEELKTVT
ncbi:hypothetical protein [Peribacillus simplex]|uniref:Uncharacterized protein n=1 Tax=Peribacillus simplex NBRC 15720 = DSM 1321 TaxID=1349754 RepID=A0A223EL83_9BACI|nr:hypothetical protein [Peribacillus simplex]ASS95983.1 hypothetical protein BS1321_19975 [Peribacillus simplex NBRC 15720 = DSM 1321]MEC1396433.1 hypothetical protein [Peribacillus simplex]